MILIPPAALDIIKKFEGFESHPYLDAAGIPTIGYGHVIRQGEEFEEVTKEEAVKLLEKDVAWAALAVARLIYANLNHNQKAALISLVFNIGSGNFQRSLIRMLVNREEFEEAAAIWWQWRRAGGKILKGLVRRREAEKQLFLGE